MTSIEDVALCVSEIVAKESGNVLESNQQSMVISRMKKRMIDLGGLSPQEYGDYLRENASKEVSFLVSLLTTHHTYFFREFCHFEYLLENLPSIVERVKKRGESKIKVCSLACSRGQEVYSLAMFFERHLAQYPGMDYEIVGSDIDRESTLYAENGIYPYKEVIEVPRFYLNNHWQRGTGRISRFVRVKDQIRKKCRFEVGNVLEFEKKAVFEQYDIIFCRNLFIYFSSETIKKVCASIKKMLFPGGLLFSGLSESLKFVSRDLVALGPSIYRIKEHDENPSEVKKIKPMDVAVPKKKRPIRVLCVDDSGSVLLLLSKIFKQDPDYDLVGTAKNGLEAKEFLAKNTVDIVTLDIHMPIMDGVQYLKENYNAIHPKVIVISSASREDAKYAQKTIEYGASDFIEKPTLNNLTERSGEIKSKIKTALLSKSGVSSSGIDDSFKKDFTIDHPEAKARVLFAHFSDAGKVADTLKSLGGTQPPIFIFFEGNKSFESILKQELQKKSGRPIHYINKLFNRNEIYICDVKEDFQKVSDHCLGKSVSISIFGNCSKATVDKVVGWSGVQLLLEDIEGHSEELVRKASDKFPWTSFAHIGTEYLATGLHGN